MSPEVSIIQTINQSINTYVHTYILKKTLTQVRGGHSVM